MQKELFKDFRVEEEDRREPVSPMEMQPSFFERVRIVLSLDKMMLCILVNITAFIFLYSVGVERGIQAAKKMTQADFRKDSPVEAKLPGERLKRVELSRPAGMNLPAPVTTHPPSPTPASKSLELQTASQNPNENTGNRYTVQLITYRRGDQAKKEVERLAKKGYQAFIISSGKYHQVCVEKFRNKREAFQSLTRLLAEGHQQVYQGAYVRPVTR